MKARISSRRKFLVWGSLALGTMLGALFIPVSLSGNILISGGAGALLALLLSTIFIPELRNSYLENWGKYRFPLMFTHPTQLPQILAMIWFLGFLAFTIISKATFKIEQTTFFLDCPDVTSLWS